MAQTATMASYRACEAGVDGRRRHMKVSSARGSVTVEALALSAVWIGLIMVALQVCLLAVSSLFAQHSARSAAGALARGGDAVTAAQGALPGAWADRLEVAESADSVRVELRIPSLVPGLLELTVSGFAGTVVEPDVAGNGGTGAG